MKEYISFDSHKRYTLAEREDVDTGQAVQTRLEHRRGAIRDFLHGCQPGTAVAVEAMGSWYWIIEEIEDAGLCPQLVHPRKAKMMMGMINKTDKLDVHGLNRLQRNGTLPTVWIPPQSLRDLRELTRSRVTMTRQRTRLKNRTTALLAKHNLQVSEYSDAYGRAGRSVLDQRVDQLPEQTRWVAKMQLGQLDFVQAQITEQETRVKALARSTSEVELLMTIPGIAFILGTTIMLEVGDVGRFASAEKLASYSGTTPRVHASGGRVRYGQLRPDVNRYLKWAFAEAANSIALNRRHWPHRHSSRLYDRIRNRKGHAKAVGAVSRHLAEAAFVVLNKKEPYRDPAFRPVEVSARQPL